MSLSFSLPVMRVHTSMQSSQAHVAAGSHLCAEAVRMGAFPRLPARAGGLPSVRRDLKIALTGPGSFVALEQWVVSPSLDPAPLQLCGDQSTEWAVGGMHPSATCKQSSV